MRINTRTRRQRADIEGCQAACTTMGNPARNLLHGNITVLLHSVVVAVAAIYKHELS
jgi:hypothetical protein